MSMFEDNAAMLTNNSDLFDLTEADLTVPERLQFPKNELIEGTVIDCYAIDKIGAVKLEVLLNNTDHAGKCHEVLVNKPKVIDGKMNPTAKRMWTEFLLAFWSREQILARQVDMASPVGKKISYRAGELREYNGKQYQGFMTFKVQE